MGPRIAALAVAVFAVGCAATGTLPPSAVTACPAGEAMVETQIFFGLSKPKGGTVSAREWEAFVKSEIAPRYPEGFTVFDGAGFWRDGASGRTISEKSKVVMRLQAAGADAETKTAAIIAAYKTKFAQEAVLRADRPVCAMF